MSFSPAPVDIHARIWVDLPKQLGWTKRDNALVQKFIGKPAHSFLEGPAFDRDGNLYVVNFAFGEVVKITPDGTASILCRYEGAPNGLQIGADGMIYITDRLKGVMRLDPASGQIELHCGPGRSPLGFAGLSDLTIAGNGDIYFTDQGDSHLLAPTGRLFRLKPSGRLDIVMEGLPGPNGVVLNPAATHVFVAITYGPAIWRGRVGDDGPADKVGVFQTLPGGYSGTDGLAMDVDGGLAACHNRLGTVWLFDPDGEPRYRVRSPTDAGRKITNVAYGGPDNSMLFMTEVESGCILVADAPVAGLPTIGQAGRRA